MISSAISWYFRQRHQELWQMSTNSTKYQLELLEYFTEKLSRTVYGISLGVKDSIEYEEFKKRVPIAVYEDLKPYILRSMNGEQKLIWPADITWFAKSSGTTSNEPKFIPITFEALEYNHFKGSKEPITQFFDFSPDAKIFDGKGLLIGGSHKVNQMNSKSYYGDLSAVLMSHMPSWANWKSTPDLHIAIMDNWEEKLEKMALATIQENVTSISGAPTWSLVLLNRILEITGKSNVHEVWPNLELFIHGGMSFEPYRQKFLSILPDPKMTYIETYNASEGFFGVQAALGKKEMLLMTHHGVFYEFFPVNESPENAIPLWEVIPNVNYGMIITNNSGLWRYVIGDTVMFSSLNPPLFKITGRTKLFINAFGEELIIDNTETAIANTCHFLNQSLVDYTAAPRFEKGSEGHEWIIELEEPIMDKNLFINLLDDNLKKVNSDYQSKRNGDILMKLPTVHFVPKGTFNLWLQKKGKLGGQNKVPRLSNTRLLLDEILSAFKNAASN